MWPSPFTSCSSLVRQKGDPVVRPLNTLKQQLRSSFLDFNFYWKTVRFVTQVQSVTFSLFISLSLCLCHHLFVPVSLSLCLYLFISLSLLPSASPFICLSLSFFCVCPSLPFSLCLSLTLSVSLFICLSLSFYFFSFYLFCLSFISLPLAIVHLKCKKCTFQINQTCDSVPIKLLLLLIS